MNKIIITLLSFAPLLACADPLTDFGFPYANFNINSGTGKDAINGFPAGTVSTTGGTKLAQAISIINLVSWAPGAAGQIVPNTATSTVAFQYNGNYPVLSNPAVRITIILTTPDGVKHYVTNAGGTFAGTMSGTGINMPVGQVFPVGTTFTISQVSPSHKFGSIDLEDLFDPI